MSIDVSSIKRGDTVVCGSLVATVHQVVRDDYSGQYMVWVCVEGGDRAVPLFVWPSGKSTIPDRQYDITEHRRAPTIAPELVDEPARVPGARPSEKYWMVTTRTVRRDDDEYERYVTTVIDVNPVEYALSNSDELHTQTIVWAYPTDADAFLRMGGRYSISTR